MCGYLGYTLGYLAYNPAYNPPISYFQEHGQRSWPCRQFCGEVESAELNLLIDDTQKKEHTMPLDVAVRSLRYRSTHRFFVYLWPMFQSSMLRNSASGPEIGLPGLISAGF